MAEKTSSMRARIPDTLNEAKEHPRFPYYENTDAELLSKKDEAGAEGGPDRWVIHPGMLTSHRDSSAAKKDGFEYAQKVHTLSDDAMAAKRSSAERVKLELRCVAPVLSHLYRCAASEAWPTITAPMVRGVRAAHPRNTQKENTNLFATLSYIP